MDANEISQRAEAIMNASPAFPEIYRGALFPAGPGGKPTIVPVPLDHGLGMYMFPDDLRTQAWVGTQSAAQAPRFKQWRMEAGGGTVYLAWAYAQKITAATGGAVNAVLSDASATNGKPRTVYGDVLILKESQARECIVDLDEADLKHVREKFGRWWAIHGADPDQMLS
ncbi:hypothetical protein MKEN_00323800 [Mycena kentingensis (nom. inval.)]|nr:hypothetical protein MKEN_00323800 [Mycena kentingensis (nom. inval.)]